MFWDYRLLEGEGGWSSQGCQASSGDAATNCTCYHLNSFSVLMSASLVPSSFALTSLSTLGTWASILALVANLAICYLIWPVVVKNKVARLRYTTLVNLTLSLLTGSV
ncbi:hypothetical protein JRQ81_005456 [Phrynocephalus forsythii]|uniref:GAIN-B domain-containing protein n=1 Tax=Phrynocephalus forsythii TaxID=171643 RepID=A0A9Q0Y3Y3_9SAUR|nr:hypothetical protein JRQ81_005456 [Phrynocephalus forsythii]